MCNATLRGASFLCCRRRRSFRPEAPGFGTRRAQDPRRETPAMPARRFCCGRHFNHSLHQVADGSHHVLKYRRGCVTLARASSGGSTTVAAATLPRRYLYLASATSAAKYSDIVKESYASGSPKRHEYSFSADFQVLCERCQNAGKHAGRAACGSCADHSSRSVCMQRRHRADSSPCVRPSKEERSLAFRRCERSSDR